jgi:hypothetical protein
MKNPKLVNQMLCREEIGFSAIINSGFCYPSANAIIGSFYFYWNLNGNVADFLTPL